MNYWQHNKRIRKITCITPRDIGLLICERFVFKLIVHKRSQTECRIGVRLLYIRTYIYMHTHMYVYIHICVFMYVTQTKYANSYGLQQPPSYLEVAANVSDIQSCLTLASS